MSGADKSAHEAPVPSTSSVPTAPPKRFLAASSSTRKLLVPTLLPKPLPTLKPLPALNTLPGQKSEGPPRLQPSAQALRLQEGPPKLQSAPQQAAQSPSPPPKLKVLSSPQKAESPPTLTRVPTVVLTPVDIAKFKEARVPEAITSPPAASSSQSSDFPPPPTLVKMPISTRKEKRAATEEPVEKPQLPDSPRKRTRVKSGESCESTAAATPRKIIQEIFGPDKSKKKSKGKGRKKRRAAPTPKKKILVDEPSKNEVKDDDHEEEEEDEEQESPEVSKHEEKRDSLEPEPDAEDGEVERVMAKSVADEEDEHGSRNDTASITSASSRRFSRRKALQEATDRMRRQSQDDEELEKKQEEEEEEEEEEVEEEVAAADGSEDDEKGEEEEEEEETRAASIHSRRSTTDGSLKSGSSMAPLDSESSMGLGMSSTRLTAERLRELEEQQRGSPLTSEDEEGGRKMEHGSDVPEHRDSDDDVDSVYSWKPVRAAAAFALEQVTKNQGGSGSMGTPGDAEARAAAAAERRARKISRHKGKSRKSLMFKTSSSKRFTKIRHSRYTAQPVMTPKVFHRGQYYQAGDVVYVPLVDETPMFGQIRGLVKDHCGNISAGIRFLAPKHPVYAFMDFDPINYSFRYDVSERLVKINFVNFVMHLNPDYYDGHPFFSKIEKHSLYTRMGKSLKQPGGPEDDCRAYTSEDSSSGSEDENGVKKKKEPVGRKRHISDSSTDDEEQKKKTEEENPLGIKKEEKSDDDDSDAEVVGKKNTGEEEVIVKEEVDNDKHEKCVVSNEHDDTTVEEDKE